ncbi:hypothetical protein Trydic_g19099 [Trypoxylus dichotomus]
MWKSHTIKGGVDALDEECTKHSTSRRAQRWWWILVMSMDMLFINASKKIPKKTDFLQILADELVRFYLSRRAENTNLKRDIRPVNSKPSPPNLLPYPKPKIVVNLSSRPLSDNEELVLAKGLNYAVSPKEGIITELKLSIGTLPSVTADQIRFETAKCLISANPPRSNLTHEEIKGAEKSPIKSGL